ncbi:MAG: zf-HC2 domain-containing protein [Nocardioides sp.]|uniref:zf-HC2 domain-containing protein n=1 Tax=Nocardioides sp. TaxID=35761 RepID=UPI00238EBF45|nr:zf-HC2 domain-containing protein [Nocardioides sp.]MDE0775541.1 zf-HC2 domain-containing protein [Nocardioides sp.]
MNLTTCWWASRRLDRYLDGDPSAVLSSADVRRVERHAATCRRCAGDLAERRRLREALRDLDARRITDPASLERLDAMAAQLRSPGTA